MKGKFRLILTVILSVLIGTVNGFFGGGGGMLCVPMLEKVNKLPTQKAHATAIMIIAPISLLSAAAYLFSGSVDEGKLPLVIAGVIVGGLIGAVALKKLPPAVTGLIFALSMIVVGVRLAV